MSALFLELDKNVLFSPNAYLPHPFSSPPYPPHVHHPPSSPPHPSSSPTTSGCLEGCQAPLLGVCPPEKTGRTN